jgi:hypothetical protein
LFSLLLGKKKTEQMSSYQIVHDFEKNTRTVVFQDFYGKKMSVVLDEDITLKHPEPTEEEFKMLDDGSEVADEAKESRTLPGERFFEFEKPTLFTKLWPANGPLMTKGEKRHFRNRRLLLTSFFFTFVFVNYKKSLKL